MQTARVVKRGDGQADLLPKESHIEGDTVYIRREGDTIILIPCRLQTSWQGLRDAIGMASPDFMEERDQGEQQERPELDEMFP